MKIPRTKLIGLVSVVAACVPTEPEKEPRGGVSVTFLPSVATAGEPFQTLDGWTVTIEKTALRASAAAMPQKLDYGVGYGSGGQPHVVDPRYQCELRATGVSPGPALVYVTLQTFDPKWGQEVKDEDVCAVDELTVRRFKTYGDDVVIKPESELTPYDRYQYAAAPGFYVKATAVKDGRSIAIDLALGVSTSPPDYGSFDQNGEWKPTPLGLEDVVNIVANQGAPAQFEVHFESFFAGGIDPLAAADTNHDGIASPDELRAVHLTCSQYADYSGPDDSDDDDYGPGKQVTRCHTLLDQLKLQAATVVAKGPKSSK